MWPSSPCSEQIPTVAGCWPRTELGYKGCGRILVLPRSYAMSDEWLDAFLQETRRKNTIPSSETVVWQSAKCVKQDASSSIGQLSSKSRMGTSCAKAFRGKPLCPKTVRPLKVLCLSQASKFAQTVCKNTCGSTLPLHVWLIANTFGSPFTSSQHQHVFAQADPMLVRPKRTTMHNIYIPKAKPSKRSAVTPYNYDALKNAILRRRRFIYDDPLDGNTIRQIGQAIKSDNLNILLGGSTSCLVPVLGKWLFGQD